MDIDGENKELTINESQECQQNLHMFPFKGWSYKNTCLSRAHYPTKLP